MQRLNFTLDDSTVRLLDRLADEHFGGNKSLTVRAALESLASHAGRTGWVIGGYLPVEIADQVACHTCGEAYRKGMILYRPVFERGESATALRRIPSDNWLDCPNCIEETST